MQIRVCNRCGAQASQADVTNSLKTVVIPASSPSTNPVAADAEVSLAIQIAPEDLCAVCQGSALVEYALARLSPDQMPAALEVWKARGAEVIASVTDDRDPGPLALPPVVKP